MAIQSLIAYQQCRPYTMTSRSRMMAIWDAIARIHKEGIQGDIVECGVWKGGSMMMAAKSLLHWGDRYRTLWLYDTFDGMPLPQPIDYDLYERPADRQWYKGWCAESLDNVIGNMKSTKYPHSQMQFVVGKVENTIPKYMPEKIALLRLDTDWYSSTAHELKHMYPLLSPGGVLIIDDYGHWNGSRQAVDEYFGKIDMEVIDYTARMIIKPKE